MGSKGEVTEQLATMLKSLWSLQYDPEISIRFKSLVDKHASQYKGGRQHDAQEFLLWLLDQVLTLVLRNNYLNSKRIHRRRKNPSSLLKGLEWVYSYTAYDQCSNIISIFQVHEDLNTASRRNRAHRKYKFPIKSGNNNTNDPKAKASADVANHNDEAQQAADALDIYMKSNSSFVMDIFQVRLY